MSSGQWGWFALRVHVRLDRLGLGSERLTASTNGADREPGTSGNWLDDQTLRRSNGQFRVVTIVDCDPDVVSRIQAQVTLKRPRVGEFISGEDWLDRVQEVLRLPYTYTGTES